MVVASGPTCAMPWRSAPPSASSASVSWLRVIVCVRRSSGRVVLDDGSALRPDYVFSLYGSEPRTEPLRDLPLTLSRSGFVRIDQKNGTNLKAFFAAGDVTDRYSHQVVTAAHEGAAAAMSANHVLYPPRQRL
jgi:thioredoxin reductase